MKNIDIYIPPKAFIYLIHNGTLDRTVTPGKPKYVVYYRKRDNTLGGTTLSLDKFGTFAEMCVFPSRNEKELFKDGVKYIGGVDEVGRGPLIGPVVAACVVLPQDFILEGLNDSKKLSAKKREQLAEIIKQKAIEYQIQYMSVEEVDELNVYEASRQAMMKCVRKMKHKVDYVSYSCQ